MAATNYTPIQLYYSTTASAAPTAGNLVNGELAINITDGKLYYKDNGGNVQVIATKGAGTIGGSNTQIQFNDGGALAGNAAMVFNKATNVTTLTTLNLTNALGATYGGTAQSAYAQGDLLYASAVNTLSKLSIGTVNYILTSTGSVPQWVAPTSVTVQTANNLAGGAAGSVPYQSAADTTTFLSIGAANRVMTSTGSAPQWVTSLTGLTGVSSSSMTNTSLTSGRVVYSGASGVQTDSANLTFNGTTLSAGGFSTTGNSTLVKLVTIGDSSFTTGAVLAAATPAKLYIGTGAVTDGTSAGGATNTLGTITAFGQTQVIATNANVTYTNLATLYIAGAPTAGTNVTITNPYSLYIAAGAAYFGGSINAGALTVTNLTDSALTSGRVPYASTGGLLVDSANLLYSGTDLTVYGITVGRGAGAVSTNTAVGASALAANTTGGNLVAIGYNALASYASTSATVGSVAVGNSALSATTTGTSNTAVGDRALTANTTGSANTAVGYVALAANTTGTNNTAVGRQSLTTATTAVDNTAVGFRSLYLTDTGSYNVAVGREALQANITANNNTAVGFQAAYSNTGGTGIVAVGWKALYGNTTGTNLVAVGGNALTSNTIGDRNVAVGYNALDANSSGGSNTTVGDESLGANTTGNYNTALGTFALNSNTTASSNTAVGYQAGYTGTTATQVTAIGVQAGYGNTADRTIAIGFQSLYANTGDRNTSVGWSSMIANTSGGYNVAVGHEALRLNTTASNAVAVGYNALRVNTTGENNTGVGAYALGSNTTATGNTAFGFQAASSNTTGAGITALGSVTLTANTTGSANVAVGGSWQGNVEAALSANTTGSANTAVGVGSLAKNTTASNNTAVGYRAGYSNTTGTALTFVGLEAGLAGTTAIENTGLGYRALTNATTGNYNTAVGTNSGAAITTGAGNTSMGRSSLQTATTASDNTSIGYRSMISTTTGVSNTALGSEALQANTTASYSTAVGYQSLYSHTTGGNNTAYGSTSLYSTTVGSGNTALGQSSLYSNTSGSNNVVIGLQAGYNSTTGNNNTIVGYQAGSSLTTAANNTFVGQYAGGLSGYGPLTGNNNTCIGQGSGINLTSGQGNTFVGNAGYVNQGSGGLITTGSKNAIFGAYNGNQSGLDIRTASNNIVISDGDGEPRLVYYNAAPLTKISGVLTHNFTDTQSKSQINLYDNTNGNTEIASGYSTADFVVATGGATGNLAYSARYNGYFVTNTGVVALINTTFTVGSNTYTVTASSSEGYIYCTPDPIGEAATGTLVGVKYATEGFRVTDTRTAQFKSTVGVGNTAGASSGAGITFPATQNASSNANTLDDYEEGSWSPVLASAGGGTVSLGTAARYVKIGRVVMVSLENYAVDTTGLGVGNLTITGFPFSESGSVSPAIAYFQLAGATSASNGALVAYMSNSSVAQLYKSESTGAGINNLTKADVNSSISLRFNGYYFTST